MLDRSTVVGHEVECGKLLQLSLTHVNVLPHLFTTFWEYGDEGMTLFNLCQVIESLALFGDMWQTTQLI